MSVPVRDFLKRRRDRALGSILGHLERECFKYLPDEVKGATRNVVMDALNMYHDTVLDLVKAEDGVRNDKVIELLEAMGSDLKTLKRHPIPTGALPGAAR